jgi:hypothetical protein
MGMFDLHGGDYARTGCRLCIGREIKAKHY